MMKNFRLVRHFLLRRAGFSFGMLEELAATRSSVLAQRVVSHEIESAQLRQRLLTEVLPAEVSASAARGERDRLRALSRLRRCVGRDLEPQEADVAALSSHGAVIAWMACRQSASGLRAELADAMQADYRAIRAHLHALLAREDVREALFLLSPDFFTAASRWLCDALHETTDAKERAFEQRLFLFLQRLAAKNETTSFFGPLTYGMVDAEADQWSFGPETETGVVQREVFAAFWAVAALGRAACQDVALRRALPVRRLGVASIRQQKATTASGKSFEVSAGTAKLFQAITDQATVADLASRLGMPLEHCEKMVSRLEQLGLVRRDLEPVSTDARALAELRARLPEGEAWTRWREHFDRFGELLQRFARAPLSERRQLLVRIETLFQEITGEGARREAGHMYADRQVFYEDCAGDMQPVLCPLSEAERIERELAPILRLGAAYGELRHRAIRELAGRVLDEIGSPVPFLTFAEAIDTPARHTELQTLLEPALALKENLRQLVIAASDGQVARISADEIESLIAIEPHARAVSLDLMFARRAGQSAQIVLGEAHPYVFAWGSQAHFAPDKAALLREFASDDFAPWGGQRRMAMVLRRRRHKGLVSGDFPGYFIEVSGRAGVPQSRRVAVADMLVIATEAGPILQTPEGEELQLYVGENDHLHLRCFAPPQVEMPLISGGAEMPRIQIGDVVYQRRRWQLAEQAYPLLTAAASPGQRAIEIARQRMVVGWPRYLFAHSHSEPKPICLDLDIPFAQATLKKLLQKGGVTLVEMMPCPQTLWLQRRAGLYTSELRVQFVL